MYVNQVQLPSGTGMFVSKEHEVSYRRSILKKLTFCVFAAPTDYYLAKLPAIQEKVVDNIKTSDPKLLIEVFFCIQALFCRVSSKAMANIWPVFLNELIRLFKTDLRNNPDDLNAILAAFKVLVTLNQLGNDDYHWFFFLSRHQWIFLPTTDGNSRTTTISALYHLSSGNIVDINLDKLMRLKNVIKLQDLIPFVQILDHYASGLPLHLIDLDMVMLEGFLE